MKLALLFHGDGRGDYLAQSVQSAFKHVHHPVTARLMVNDEADPEYIDQLNQSYPEYTIAHTGRVGMARAVQAGFDLCIAADVDAVLWVEEDFVVERDLPISRAYRELDLHHHLAQMLFQRQNISDEEHAAGSVAGAMNILHADADYVIQDTIFSLNPCLIPRRVFNLPYPTGPLGIGNEAGFTALLLAAGYQFGVWTDGGQAVTHIGAGRSEHWQL